MTIQEVREMFLQKMWEITKEDSFVDESDKELFYAEYEKEVAMNGGWQSVYNDIQKGIENGYTVEKQFDIMAEFVRKVG